jgi:hypothetical protein
MILSRCDVALGMLPNSESNIGSLRGSEMLFMVIEDFRGREPKAIYRRFHDKGRMMPDGLRFHSRWVAADMSRCFQFMEADDHTPPALGHRVV